MLILNGPRSGSHQGSVGLLIHTNSNTINETHITSVGNGIAWNNRLFAQKLYTNMIIQTSVQDVLLCESSSIHLLDKMLQEDIVGIIVFLIYVNAYFIKDVLHCIQNRLCYN